MNKEDIVVYLAQGIKAAKVASILGCSEAYVSEVQTEYWFSDALEEAKKKIKKSEDDEKTEVAYTKLESAVLKQVGDEMPFADFKDLIRLTEVLIRRKQTNLPTGGIVFNNTQNNTVLLQIPAAVAPEIILNSQSEIVAVGNKTMSPMTTQSVRKLFEAIEEKKSEPARVEKLIKEGRILETIPDDF